MKVCAECGRCYDDSVNFCTESNHQDLSSLRDGDPNMVAGYRLDYLLESGLRGESYRAQQIESGRSCLIRVLSANKTNSEQFWNDARIASAFFHPSVTDIYEVGSQENGELFVVAEDAGGKDLRGFLDSVGVPELMTSIEIIRQAAEALDALHRAGLVHRAVNPENIILTNGSDGRLLVRIQNPDFGGAVQTSIVSNKFLIDSALGSLRYFAPEQCSGGEATPQTDVYSLGIVFYEMLAGTPPFDASKAVALIEKHRSQRPPDVRINNFNLRMLVTHALSESLQKQPKLRQPSANALARQLRHMEQLANHVSTPPPAGVVPAEPVRTSPHVNIYESELKRPVIQPIAKKSRSKRKDRTRPVIDVTSQVPETILATDDAATSTGREIVATVTDPVTPIVETRSHENPGHVRSRLSRLKLQMKSWRSKQAPQELAAADETNAIQAPSEPVATATVEVPQIFAQEEEPVIQRTKVECEPLEDDIPTIDEVLEVLAKEQVEHEVVAPVSVEVIAPVELFAPVIETETIPAVAEAPNPIEEISLVHEETESVEVDEEIDIKPETIVAVAEMPKVEEEILLVTHEPEPVQAEEEIQVINVEPQTVSASAEILEEAEDIAAVEIAPETIIAEVVIEEDEIPVIHVEGEAIAAVPEIIDVVKVEDEIQVIQVENEIPVIQVEGETAAVPDDAAEPVKIEEEIAVGDAEPEPAAVTPPAVENSEKKDRSVRRKRQRAQREFIEPPVVELVQTKDEIVPVAEIPSHKQKPGIPIGHMQLEDVPVIRPSKPARPAATGNDARVPWVKGVFKPIKEVERIPVVRDELEEITLVRVAKPIKIDVARPVRTYGERRDKMFSFDTQDAVRFVPTLLGDTEKRRTIELDPKDAMFSSLGSPRTVPTRIRRRLIVATGASALLIVGFLFGGDLGRYLQAAGSDESVVASSAPTAPAVAPAKSAVAKTEKVKSAAKPDPVEKDTKPSTAKEKSTPVIEKPSTSTARGAKPTDKDKSKLVEAAKRPTEKKKSAPAEKKVTPPAKKAGAGTRARIVGGA